MDFSLPPSSAVGMHMGPHETGDCGIQGYDMCHYLRLESDV